MLKSKFKLFLFLFSAIILLNSIVFATDISTTETNITNDGDIYIENKESTEITKMILGNAFISTKDFVLSPHEEGGIITGDLFIIADNVSLKSDVTYTTDNKVETVNISSKIFGNAYIITDKFTLEPGSSIEGDLYVIAKEVELGQSSVIYGNAFICSDKVNLSGQIAGNTYVTSEEFTMTYNGLILQDLYLNSSNSTLSGIIRRNAFLKSNDIITNSDFIVYSNLNAEAKSIELSGEVKENAKLVGKNIYFGSNASILGNLDYSTKNELELSSELVSGKTNFSKLKLFNFEKTFTKIISFASLVIYCISFYFIIKKFFNGFMDKLSNFKTLDILKFLGFGVLTFVILPLIIALLLFIRVGSLLAFIILAIYILLLTLSVPTFITGFSEFIHSKFDKIPSWLYVIMLSGILYGLSFIPYAGSIIVLLGIILGIGIIINNLK
ncbi:MAG: hypothetical protein E7310_01755 [Clostridiales bacterium]|nr:hypothetical protein [Clostridiales bacterium]